MAVIWALLGVGLLLLTVVGTVELWILTVAGWRAAPRVVSAVPRDPRKLRLAVVVPAHDEAGGIARTVQSLITCDGAAEGVDIVVVADNCTDETAAEAERAGARVLVRDDPERRGKGYALDYAFREIWRESHDIYVVVDADTVVEIDFFEALRRAFASGAEAAQVRYLTADGDRSLRTRLMRVAFAGMNVVRPRGRDRLGLSAGVLGNGFALSRAILREVPYGARSIVEDLEYHLRLVRAGRRVRFVDETAVRSEMPASVAAASSQRARWEGGRLAVARAQLPGLLADLRAKKWHLLEPTADLLLPPLALHVGLLLLALLVPFFATQVYALIGLAVVALHVGVSIAVGGGGWGDLRAVAAAPLYMLWKLRMIGGVLRAAGGDSEWVRTAREPASAKPAEGRDDDDEVEAEAPEPSGVGDGGSRRGPAG